ncbi:hypothetical protein FRC07_014350, partial [Ceratobasidium sp. 392]
PVDDKRSISKLEFNEESGSIDGIRITYRYIDSKTGASKEGKVVHGSFNEEEVHHSYLELPEDEYISGAQVWYGNKGTEDQYIGRVTLWACRPKVKHPFRAGDWGEIPDSDPQTDDWHVKDKSGRLFVFGARQDNNASSKGLKALCFGESQGQVVAAHSGTYPPVPASTQGAGKEFNDVAARGSSFLPMLTRLITLKSPTDGVKINYKWPIKRIEVWHDKIIEGIQVTYNLNNGETCALMHGSKSPGVPSRIDLKETETVVEVTGIHGVACPDTQWGDRVNLLDFKIYDSKTGMFRSAGTFGKLQESFKQVTRKDICARGPLIGLAGRADNSQKQAGLYSLQFFTRVPPWKGLSNG